MRYLLFKRLMDLAIAIVLSVVLLPVLLLIMSLLTIQLKGTPIFIQERIGKNGRVFLLFKLRSLNKSLHTTRFTQWLRSTGMDELPQLLNVILGQMSLVGPRPLPVDYHSRIRDEHKVRQLVLPGITGLAQIHGNSDWLIRFEDDVRYVETAGFWIDLKIIYLTIILLFTSKKEDHTVVLPHNY